MFRYLLVFATLVIALHVKSQSKGSKLNNLITIDRNEIDIKSLLQIIIKNTGMELSYNPERIKNVPKLKILKHTLSAAQWLDELKETTKINYKILGDHIILTEGKVQSVSFETSPKAALKLNAKTIVPNVHKGVKEHPFKAIATNTAAKEIDTTTYSYNKISEDSILKITTASSTHSPIDTAAAKVKIDSVNRGDHKISYADLQPVRTKTNIKERNSADLQNLTTFDLGPQGLGIGLERKLAHKFVLASGVGIGASYILTQRHLKYRVNVHALGLYISANPRWYYNGTRKRSDGSESSGNSGSYVGVRIKYVHDLSKVKDYGSVMLFNIHWGIQRMLNERVLINAHIGPGYAIPTHRDVYGSRAFYPSVDIKFSYKLRK